MKIVPQLLILTLSILVFSASAQTPQPARRNGKAPKLLKVTSEVLEKSAVKRVRPIAPAGAPSSGVVRVRVWVDPAEGKVVEAKVISGRPLLRESALKAARQWEWEFICIDGPPMLCVGVLSFDFSEK
jgi:outer membrane biosynthesis protein TonB